MLCAWAASRKIWLTCGMEQRASTCFSFPFRLTVAETQYRPTAPQKSSRFAVWEPRHLVKMQVAATSRLGSAAGLASSEYTVRPWECLTSPRQCEQMSIHPRRGTDSTPKKCLHQGEVGESVSYWGSFGSTVVRSSVAGLGAVVRDALLFPASRQLRLLHLLLLIYRNLSGVPRESCHLPNLKTLLESTQQECRLQEFPLPY